MTPHDLKNSVWQLAVQGKLVDQRPDEGTGAELFQQIQAEKQALIKAGKIKKEKPLPEITEDEKPFDLPDGWCWARLETICSLITDGTHKTPSYTTNGVRFLSVKDISGGYFDLSNTKCISENEHAQLTQRCKPENGDVLICRIGTLGKALAIDIDLEFSIFVSLGLIKPINKELAKYIETVINSGYGFSWIQKVKVGGGTHTFKINLDDLRMFPIPLPPLAEQKRIVAKLEEILPLIDRYEAAWNKLEAFNKRFPGDMQKSILQLAIQGKLVEQRPEEGTGEELFQQIQLEKQALIKAGKIKKEKPLPEIAEDEIPFSLPANWKLTKLGNCITLFSGSDFKPDEYNEKGKGIPYITGASSLSDSGVILNRWTDVPRIFANRGDVLLVCKGSGYGKTVICDIEEAHIARQIMAIKKSNALNMEYIRYFLQANFDLIKTKGQGVIPGIDRGSVLNLVIALPPLAEQKRIVAKLEEILPLCDRLK